MERPNISLSIFAKPPIPGRTKSRLAASVGETQTAKLAEAMLLDLLTICTKITEAETTLWIPPDSTKSDFKFPHERSWSWSTQVGANLGERLEYTMRQQLLKFGTCCIIGADCITFDQRVFSAAVDALRRTQVVIVPADDGGYTLIAANVPCPELFRGIDWGSERVLAQTLSAASAAGIEVTQLAPTFDIDVESDLYKLEKLLQTEARPYCQIWIDAYRGRCSGN